ncbi:DUF1801 domain-containing protein [Cognatishimia sp. SS12]|uniref:DUF1801 domain-containing protein n=1 Tax=Cognatishimia sp. SS12 TaxID=2979465 RepID=UPI00232C0FEB|nr:DUF1801 domain-containing protein [Cognatishimia sp. SS12]MDC0738523.1 DUF1801 domain-containing protein [Cognatishimia sp. SS12]
MSEPRRDNQQEAVDAWMAAYDNPQKELVQAVRLAILDVDPRIGECIKWQAPTFTYKGNIASFFPKAKKHASLMFHKGAEIPGDFAALEGDGKEARSMKFADMADLEAKRDELTAVVRAWINLKG